MRLRRARPGIAAAGLEFRPEAAARARAKAGVPVAVGSVNAVPFADGAFGGLVSLDVLCHAAAEPDRALAEFRRVLRPGGQLALNLPAFQWLHSAHDVRVHNTRRFTAGGVRALLAAAGFAEVRARYWNALLFPLMVVQRKVLARGADEPVRRGAAAALAQPEPRRGHGGGARLDGRRPALPRSAVPCSPPPSVPDIPQPSRRTEPPVDGRHPTQHPPSAAARRTATRPPWQAPTRRPAPDEAEIGLSIVVPVYRGAATVGRLVEALSALRPAGGIEIVLVNDGSPDNSGEVCRELAARATVPLTYLEHARNFGEHNAVMTGLRHARGAFVITMDDDLQNPPEEVLKLYDHARLGGWDVVYTRYAEKQHEGWRNLGSRFANRVADVLLDKPQGLYLSSFRCMSALVVREVTKYAGPYPYVDGLIMQVTQRIDSIEVLHLAARGGALQLQHRPAGAALAEPGDQLLGAAAAPGDAGGRRHGRARPGRRGAGGGRGGDAAPRPPAGPRSWR